MALKTFFSPKSVAVVGASTNPEKLGSIILQNLIESEYSGDLLAVNPKNEGEKTLGINTIGRISDAKASIDLVIIVIPGKFAESVIDECIINGSKNVIIISAGFKEVGNETLESQIQEKCIKNGINLLGPNCLGAICPTSKLNASFSDGFPQAGNICFVSQSGAFCTAMLDWANSKKIGFSHFISLGNKAGISEIDILEGLATDDSVGVFAFYLESNAEGKRFLKLIEKVSPNKPIIILEPGQSQKAAAASSSHTGSLAPNFKVLQTAYAEAGAIQVYNMRDMFGVLEVFSRSADKNKKKNLAIITNAGGVGVLSTDLSEMNHLDLPEPNTQLLKKLQNTLPSEAGLNNPIDIIGDARAERYEKTLKIISQDSHYDQILVLLTPQRTTQVKETAEIIVKIAKESDKNIIASFIGGAQVKAGIDILNHAQIPHFEFPSDALASLGLIADYEANKEIKAETEKEERFTSVETQKIESIKKRVARAKNNKLKSLPQPLVEEILEAFELDHPHSGNFTDFQDAKNFFKKIDKVVLKISSPDALHKTDLQGVFLNIDTDESFEKAWYNLDESINIAQFKNASIQVQEQIPSASEVILGINTDPTFGKIMLFGSGGIYTEVMHDTAIATIPVKSTKKIIDQTKIGIILNGVRGEKPKAVKALRETMRKIEAIVQTFPEIISIDANPILVTEDRAVCVDLKLILE